MPKELSSSCRTKMMKTILLEACEWLPSNRRVAADATTSSSNVNGGDAVASRAQPTPSTHSSLNKHSESPWLPLLWLYALVRWTSPWLSFQDIPRRIEDSHRTSITTSVFECHRGRPENKRHSKAPSAADGDDDNDNLMVALSIISEALLLSR